jgi:23S rRNA (cytidine2498-2'-O)-methyltransferase
VLVRAPRKKECSGASKLSIFQASRTSCPQIFPVMAKEIEKRHIAITRDGQEELLCRELNLTRPKLLCRTLSPRIVEIVSLETQELAKLPILFCSQLLLFADPLAAQSISLWGDLIFNHLRANRDRITSPWVLRIFDPLTAETGLNYARPRRIYESVRELLRRRNRELLRSLVLSDSASGEVTLVQVVTQSASAGFISIASATERRPFRAAISLDTAGYHAVAEDKSPPSRAYRKLLEAIDVFRLEIKPGSRAVDLGAAPGGWSYVLLKLGAHVTAVDRSPLAREVAMQPAFGRRLVTVIGDALKWKPDEVLDWMVCDVITTPENTAALVKRWVDGRMCRNLCVTVKFKGTAKVEVVVDLLSYLSERAKWFDARQLSNNRNELTLVAKFD